MFISFAHRCWPRKSLAALVVLCNCLAVKVTRAQEVNFHSRPDTIATAERSSQTSPGAPSEVVRGAKIQEVEKTYAQGVAALRVYKTVVQLNLPMPQRENLNHILAGKGMSRASNV